MTYQLWTKDYKTFELRSSTADPIKIDGAKSAGRALLGDTVTYSDGTVKLVKRAKHPILAGLIELNSKVKYGFTSHSSPIYLFTPFNEAYPPFVVGCSERDCSKNRLALVQFDSWTETFPRGLLQRLLPPDAEEEALYWTYTPWACAKYKGLLALLPQPQAEAQRQLLPTLTFHIDPPGCRDVDDVLSIYTLDGETRIIITIADVAELITEGSELDNRAALIGQTLYQEGNAPKHMLPAELSESLLSLLPSADTVKLGVSLDLSLSNPADTRWSLTTVKTEFTYTYESVYQNPYIVKTLTELATVLGEPTDDSHKWIEVAMKFYNTEAAKLLKQAGTGLLRSHGAPDQARLAAYTAVAPELQFLAYKSATYVEAAAPETFHWGLDTHLYTHITSPIRRYADLVNQRVLKAIITKAADLPKPTDPSHLNAVGRAAKQHDRDLTLLRAVKAQPTGLTRAQVVEIRPLTTGETKVVLYNSEWKLLLRLRYKTTADGELVSKDEKTTYRVAVGDQVTLSYFTDLHARSWKKRMVLSLKNSEQT